MIPYLSPEYTLLLKAGPIEIHLFGILVAICILVGAERTRFRARQLGLDDVATSTLTTWIVVWGFIIGHLFDVLAYQPAELVKLPLLQALALLVNPGRGLSSFGGFLGSLGALLFWTKKHREPTLKHADALFYGLPFGWFFGRLGCFTAHDHPGAFTEFFLGVKYPEGTRHDLGLDEALLALALAIVFFILSRKPRPLGLYGALMCSFYGPVRFGLDFLRVQDMSGADPRYLGLTPAQYGSIGVTMAGLFIASYVLRAPRTPPATASGGSVDPGPT